MPLYDFQCAAGHRFDRFVKLCDFHEGQACECGRDAHRLLSAPRLISDSIDPCLGPDGKMHDSLASYRRSLLPENNPKGERYTEIGNERLKPIEHKFDRKQRRDDIRAGLEDVRNGRVPSMAILED